MLQRKSKEEKCMFLQPVISMDPEDLPTQTCDYKRDNVLFARVTAASIAFLME